MKTNQCTCCSVISYALCYTCTYPILTKNGVSNLCLYQLQCTLKCMCVLVLRFSHCVAIDTYATTAL